MSDEEKKLSRYIDSLNEEKIPKEHSGRGTTPEMEELFEAVRLVRSLREPDLPDKDYGEKLASNISNRLVRKKKNRIVNKWAFSLAAAAVVLLVGMLGYVLFLNRTDMVYAMEKTFKTVKAYHGILEVVETNALGETTLQSKAEVWADKEGRYYVKGLEGWQRGVATVNNGKVKWQIQPDKNEVNLFTAFPDPYSFTFELGKEIHDIKNAIKTKLVGEDRVAGRAAKVMEVTPQGGSPYRLWIDEETKMPLQKQSALENSLRYTVSYRDIDFTEAIPEELLTYRVPSGYKEILTDSEMFISSTEEANKILGYSPRLPQNIPNLYAQTNMAAVNGKISRIYYSSTDNRKKVVVMQGRAEGELNPASMAVLGKVDNMPAEIQSPIVNETGVLGGGGAYAGITDINSVRWQEGDFEFAVAGNVTLDELKIFIGGLTNGNIELSNINDRLADKPKIEVPVDIKIEEAEQKSVDAGHTPWRLDPVFVAQVFVNLKISPEGIQGEYAVKYEELKIVKNTGTEAVVEVSGEKAAVRLVYLKRLVRQDNTGIWTVVGFDPA